MRRLLAGEALVLAVLAIAGADLAAHKRVETLAGLNMRGYRGRVALQRRPNELRIAVVGGTRAFGWGEPISGTTVAGVQFELSRVLDVPSKPLMPIVAINLGQIGARPESYPATLSRYAYLKPDYLVILDDLGEAGPSRPFDPSGVFALTGYQPMLPLVLEEKGAVTRARVLGAPLEYAGRALASADRALARAARVRRETPASASSPEVYAAAMIAAVDAAHRQARGVVVAVSPVDTPAQRRNLSALEAALPRAFGAPRWLRVVDLGRVPQLYDRSLWLDGFSFGANAASLAARPIAAALLQLIPPR